MKKKIAVVSVDHLVNRTMSAQLMDVFENYVDISPILLDKCDIIDVSDLDLIVCSSNIIEDRVRAKMNGEIPIISAKRTINYNNLSELISLNNGEKVLLVSNHLSSAIETIDLLVEFGIDHLEFVPYYPGCSEEILDIAVTPGGKHIIPPGVKRVIDIGVKIIDISTIVEIFLKLDLPTENIPTLSAKNSKEMIRFSKFNIESNKMLTAMFEVTNDGIAALDVSGNIFFYNQRFADFLGYKDSQMALMNITEFIKDKKLIDYILDTREISHEIFEINNKELMMNKVLLYQGDYLKGHVIGLQEVVHIQNLEKEVRKKLVRKGFYAKYSFEDLIGNSDELKSKIKISKKIADSDLTVLIQGEDGTGKEIFANAIHNASKRVHEPFVAVNIASLSENLVESELFGYEEGSFTGASKGGKIGFFEQADRGTIFIDEIGDISPKIQMSLLRVLQEKNIIRVGGSRIIPIDVRVIAATNKDLYNLVLKGEFRKDLYYRLNVLHLRVPTLKERIDDIPLLAESFFKKINSDKYLSAEVLEIFKNYSWPGNIRELENLIYYFANIIDKQEVTVDDLPEEFLMHYSRDKEYKRKKLDDIGVDMFQKEKIEEYVHILKILDNADKLEMKIGRNRISEILKTKNINYSSEQIRTKLKELEILGLVNIGTTRQGTSISQKGKLFLESQ
jgi:transcriptional regulator with PAS, ATPase and Fis domain